MTEALNPYPGCGVCEFLPKLEPDFVIADGTHWSVNLRDRDQTLLGTTFISLKRHAPELDQLNPNEETEFIKLRNGLLAAIRASFQPLTFNISCLKNDAFQQNPDATPSEAAHVHWHVKPRYTSQLMEFAGETFSDPLPGRYLSSFERHRPAYEVAVQIAQTIRGNLPELA